MYSQDYKAKAKTSKQITSNYASFRNADISISLSSALGNAAALQSMSNVLQKRPLPSQPGGEVVQMFQDADDREVSYAYNFFKKHITGETEGGTLVTDDSVKSEIAKTHLKIESYGNYWYSGLHLISYPYLSAEKKHSSTPIGDHFNLKANYDSTDDKCEIYHLDSSGTKAFPNVPLKPKAKPTPSFTIDDFPSIDEVSGKKKK